MAKHKKKQKQDASLNKGQQSVRALEKAPEAQKPAEPKKQGKKVQRKNAAAAGKPAVFASRAALGWVVAMSTIFPLIWDDYYFNILETKYLTMIILTLAFFAVMLLWGLVSGSLFRLLQDAAAGIREQGFFPWFRGTFDLTDISVMVFYLAAGIATAGAGKYVKQALTGNEGRFVGFYYLSLLCISYFIISRNLKFDRRIITIFLCTGWLLLLFGITDFYDMNILHFKDRMNERQYPLFTSTIGNINTYTVYVGLVLVLAGALFVLSREALGRTIFYFATMTLAFMALAMGSSDNGYLTLGAFFAFLPFAAFRTRKGIWRYFLTLTVFFADIAWVAHEMDTKDTLEIFGLFNVIADSKFLMPLIVALALATAALYFWARHSAGKDGSGEDEAPVILRRLWAGFIIAAVLAVVSLIVRANRMTMDEAWKTFGPFAAYLKFTDDWGTQRGYVWRAMWEEYTALPLRMRITGTGPDTFAVYMALNRFQDMVQVTRQTYDSVHNEYLQYLFTIGPFGLAAYLMIMISAVRSAFRKALRITDGRDVSMDKKDAPYLWAMGYLLICYSAQATVNITVPLVAPLVWMFVMIIRAAVRKTE